MTDTAGGWLDERLDGDSRWASADAGFDVEAEANALLRQAEPIADTAAPEVLSGADSWLDGHHLVDPVEPVDEIVLGSEEIEEAIASVDGITVVDGPAPWSSDDVEAGVADADTVPTDAVPTDAVPDGETGGVVDPFDVYLATTEDDAATTTIDSPVPDVDTDPGDAGRADADAAEFGSVLDDIAPAAEPSPEIAPDAAAGPARTGGVRDAEADGSGPDEPVAPEPIGGASSRLDAFDLPDDVDAGDTPTPTAIDDDEPQDGLGDLLDGDVS